MRKIENHKSQITNCKPVVSKVELSAIVNILLVLGMFAFVEISPNGGAGICQAKLIRPVSSTTSTSSLLTGRMRSTKPTLLMRFDDTTIFTVALGTLGYDSVNYLCSDANNRSIKLTKISETYNYTVFHTHFDPNKDLSDCHMMCRFYIHQGNADVNSWETISKIVLNIKTSSGNQRTYDVWTNNIFKGSSYGWYTWSLPVSEYTSQTGTFDSNDIDEIGFQIETLNSIIKRGSNSYQLRSVGEQITPNTLNNHKYICTVGGLGGTAQPTFPTGSGETVTDGEVTWQENGAFTADNISRLPAVTFDKVEFYPKPSTALCMIRIDDGFTGQDEMCAYLESKGLKATIGIVGSNVTNPATSGYLSLDRIKELQKAGHFIVNHSWSHRYIGMGHAGFVVRPISVAQYINEIARMQEWMCKNGFGSGSRIFIAPGSFYTSELIEGLKDKIDFFWLVNSASGGLNTLYDTYKCYSVNEATGAEFTADLNMSIAEGDLFSPYWHGNDAIFRALVDEIAAAQLAGTIKVITPADLLTGDY
jgi:hypothetical protein